MKARPVRIGNSRGVCLPKPVVTRSRRPIRAGGAEAARQMREAGHDRLPDNTSATRFDEQEWLWR